MARRDAYYDGYSPPSSSPFKSSPTHSTSSYGGREKLTLPSQRAWSQSDLSDSLELPPLVSDDALTLPSSSSRPHSPSSTPLDTDHEHDPDVHLSSPARDVFPFHNPTSTRPHTSYFSNSPRTQKAQDVDIATALLALHAYPRFSTTSSSSHSPPLSSPIFPVQQTHQPQPLPAPQTPTRQYHARPPALAGLLRTPSPDPLPVHISCSRAPSRFSPSSESDSLPVPAASVAAKSLSPQLISDNHYGRPQSPKRILHTRSSSIPPSSADVRLLAHGLPQTYYRSSKSPHPQAARHVTPPTDSYSLPHPIATAAASKPATALSTNTKASTGTSTARPNLPPLHDSHLINSRPLDLSTAPVHVIPSGSDSTRHDTQTDVCDDVDSNDVHDLKPSGHAPSYNRSHSHSSLPPSSPFSEADQLAPEEESVGADVDAQSRTSTSRSESPSAHLEVDAEADVLTPEASSPNPLHEVRFSFSFSFSLPTPSLSYSLAPYLYSIPSAPILPIRT